ncbi:MAG: right-handed parallel beta-helix repeat-containing protein, partial [Bacteroidales bacterium]|nr:right-handed parallel beta-helix repeat-containing protein [Bacteroidales bacterium]
LVNAYIPEILVYLRNYGIKKGTSAGIYVSINNMGNLRILNNVFRTVSTGIVLGTSMPNTHVTIKGNEITYSGLHGIYAIGSRIDFIDENKIIRNKNTLTDVYISAGGGQLQPINIAHSVYGICLENVVIDSAISKNQCYSYGGAGGLNGEEGTRDMYFKNVNASVPYPAVVCNNEITRLFGGYTFSPSTTNYGIVLDGGNNMQIYHNTIYMNPSSNQYQSNNIALYGMNAQPENVVCKNNIFVSKDYPIDNLSSSVVLDHNNYYSLTNKSFTTNDRHALCVAPLFKDVTQSLEVLNAYYMSCLNVGIDKDITGKNRDSITTMGAYDEDVFVTSVTIEELSPIDTTISFPNMQIPVKVRVFNMGKNLLTSAVLGWSLNGVIQNNNLIWTGSLVSMASDTFQLGTYLPKMNGYDTICVWVSMPNHVLDSNTYDDTLILSIYGATDLEVDWVSRPQNIVYDVNPHIVEVYIHSISGMTNISNLYLHYYYTDSNNIVQKTDSVNMVNLGSELWRASLVNIPYWNNVYYRLSLTDYVGNVIVLADSFAIQQNFVRDSVLVAMADIVSPISTQGVSQGNYPIQVVIQNKGMNNLRTCKLGYTINGGTPIIYNWIGDLYTDFTDTVNIGTYNAIAGNNDILTVWVELPNGIIDSVTIDDTLSVNVVCCDSVFSGTYRIGNTILADFTDVNEFLRNASYCGINGSVTLLVDSGKYEGFDLSVLADVMTEYDTLVITSVRGDAADVVFESNNNVVNMGDNRNIYLLHITLISSAGSGINISSACHNVEINDCIINLNSYSNSSYVGIRFIGSTSNSYFGNLRVLNNTINGGYASCLFQYTNPDTIAMHSASSRITIKHNNFINWGYYGIYTTNNTKYDWIANNEFVSSANNSTQYGIYLYQFCQIDSGIVNNRILLNNTSTSYGMYIRQVNLEWKNSALIANNEIRKILGSGTFYGIYNTYSHVNYFHNSIFHSLPQTGYGFYTAKNIDPCIVKNNVFHVNTYPIYGTLANINTVQLDYNDYYSLTNHIGYAGSAKNTLLQWQNTILQDYNSLNIKPIYQDSSVNLEMVNAEDIIAPNVGINRDIADNKRYAKTSMGSYTQKVAEGMDLSLLGIIRPEELKDGVLCIPNKLHITCVVRNMRDSIIDFSVSPLRLRMEANGVTIQQYDTLINSGIMDVMQTDTIEVTNMFDVTHVGNYSLIATISCAADTIPNNDTAYLNFDIFRSELPIDESFANGMPNTIEVWESNVANAWTVVHDSNTNVQSQYGNSLLTFDGTRGAEAKLYVKYITLYNSYNPTLEFWYYHDTTGAIGKFADIMDVSYTIDGGESFEKLIQLRKNNGVDHGWKKYTVSLLPANGNTCVVVMFDAIRMSPSEYDGTQFIDRIKVFIGQDMAISEVYIDNINSCNMSSDVKVVIENMTNQVIDFETDSTSLQLDIDGINNQSFIYPLLMGNLASLEKDTITIASALDFSKGNHTIVAKIITPIDNVSANDTLIQTLVVNPNLNVVAQQITGGNQTVNCIVSGSQVNQVVTLENDGNMDMEDVILTLNVYDITGAKVQTIEDTLTGLFAVNQTTTHTFAEAYEVPADAMYNVEIVANPMCNASLTYTDVLTECVEQSDVEVTAFINPTDDETCSSVGTNIKVKVRVSNNHPDEDIQGVVLNVVVSANN